MASALQGMSLVLNKSWIPVGVVAVKDALVLMYKGAAKAVDADYQMFDFQSWSDLSAAQEFVRTPDQEIPVPEVIVLCDFNEIPHSKVVFSRRNLYKRDKNTCQYCGAQPGLEELTIDHVVPRSHGGVSSWTNCVLACEDCNFRKADRTPMQARMPLLKTPEKPSWSPIMAIPAGGRRLSWSKFVSEAYWTTPLEE